MNPAQTCRKHPEVPAVGLCQKYGHGLWCTDCLEVDSACPDSDIYCKHRPQCLIHFRYKVPRRQRRGTEGNP